MKYRAVPILIIVGFLLLAPAHSQPRTYTVNVLGISQPDSRLPVSENITLSGQRYVTFSGAPLLVEFYASGFECPNQDLSFYISYTYRKVRPANFLEDPSLYVMEGFMTTTTVISEGCAGAWTSPGLRDGIHTVGIMAFDGSGASSPWHYIRVVKNNERGSAISMFPGGEDAAGSTEEEPPVDSQPDVIIDTPSQVFSIGSDPVQYADIHFHTNYPFLVEYFYVEWIFVSGSGCKYSCSAIVYPAGFNQGVYRLDMSEVFGNEWDEPADSYGKCAFGPGDFTVEIYAKTAAGLGPGASVVMSLA
jgi:hypothetical protein